MRMLVKQAIAGRAAVASDAMSDVGPFVISDVSGLGPYETFLAEKSSVGSCRRTRCTLLREEHGVECSL